MNSKFFKSEDDSLLGYNGMRVTVLGRWQESCEDIVTDVVEIRFADGTVFTCWPSELSDTEPEEYWCFHCDRYVAIGNLTTEHMHG